MILRSQIHRARIQPCPANPALPVPLTPVEAMAAGFPPYFRLFPSPPPEDQPAADQPEVAFPEQFPHRYPPEVPDPTEEENHDDLPDQCIPWVVQEGQTIQSLAAACGTTPDVIVRINQTSTIRPGQMIRLPVSFVVPCYE